MSSQFKSCSHCTHSYFLCNLVPLPTVVLLSSSPPPPSLLVLHSFPTDLNPALLPTLVLPLSLFSPFSSSSSHNSGPPNHLFSLTSSSPNSTFIVLIPFPFFPLIVHHITLPLHYLCLHPNAFFILWRQGQVNHASLSPKSIPPLLPLYI